MDIIQKSKCRANLRALKNPINNKKALYLIQYEIIRHVFE